MVEEKSHNDKKEDENQGEKTYAYDENIFTLVKIPEDGYCIVNSVITAMSLTHGITHHTKEQVLGELIPTFKTHIDGFVGFVDDSMCILGDLEDYVRCGAYNTNTGDLILKILHNMVNVEIEILNYDSTNNKYTSNENNVIHEESEKGERNRIYIRKTAAHYDSLIPKALQPLEKSSKLSRIEEDKERDQAICAIAEEHKTLDTSDELGTDTQTTDAHISDKKKNEHVLMEHKIGEENDEKQSEREKTDGKDKDTGSLCSISKCLEYEVRHKTRNEEEEIDENKQNNSLMIMEFNTETETVENQTQIEIKQGIENSSEEVIKKETEEVNKATEHEGNKQQEERERQMLQKKIQSIKHFKMRKKLRGKTERKK